MKKVLFAIGYILLIATQAPASSYYETEVCFMNVISPVKIMNGTRLNEADGPSAHVTLQPERHACNILVENDRAA
jgi:hypothetical protein